MSERRRQAGISEGPWAINKIILVLKQKHSNRKYKGSSFDG